MSNSFLKRSITASVLASPAWGGLTFRILHASSRVRPDDENVLVAPVLPFLASEAYLEDAAAWR